MSGANLRSSPRAENQIEQEIQQQANIAQNTLPDNLQIIKNDLQYQPSKKSILRVRLGKNQNPDEIKVQLYANTKPCGNRPATLSTYGTVTNKIFDRIFRDIFTKR